MTEDEDRHADEVQIAFQMGAEWQRDRMRARIKELEAEKAAWKGIHEGAVAAMQARINELEAALQSIKALHHEGGIDDVFERDDEAYMIAFKALEGKKDD